MIKKIVIKGAKEHNLKNISLEIPKDKFIVIINDLKLYHNFNVIINFIKLKQQKICKKR